MKIFKKTLKSIGYFLLLPIAGYFLISYLLTSITINKSDNQSENTKEIYLSTNGVHLDIIMPNENLSEELLKDLKFSNNDQYLAFGWGDENFYLNTPTWKELTFGNAFRAMFLKSSTLMHLTRYKKKRSSWTPVKLSADELKKINSHISSSFDKNSTGEKILFPGKGYNSNDDFYKAIGSYSCLKTCNSWVNTGFKKSGLKACLWTPFDFGLIEKYGTPKKDRKKHLN